MADQPQGSQREPDAPVAADSAEPEKEDRLEDLPGRPIGPDEIDPELIALPRTRARIGVVLSLSIVIFCGYIMASLYDDLRFSRTGPEPATVESMAEAIDSGNTERYVEVRAVPDRTFVVRVAKRKADPGSRLAPVQGSNGKLWLLLGGNVWTAGIKYTEVYRGRLRRVTDLPFADELAGHVQARGPEPRFVAPDRVARAIAESASTVIDPAGDTIALLPDTVVHVYEQIANEARIRVFQSEERGTAEAWAAALAQAGVLEAGAVPLPREAPVAEPDKPKGKRAVSWTFAASVPGGAEAVRSKLRESKLFGVLVEPIGKTYQTTWQELSSQGASQSGALRLAGNPVPWSDISWLSFDVSREMPEEAVVLLSQEEPDIYWYVLPLFIAMGLFGLLFLWAFVRTVRAALAPDEALDGLAEAAAAS